MTMFRDLRLVLLAVGAAAMASAARGQDCGKDMDQTSLNICAGKSLAAVDARLNEAYRQIRRRMTSDPEGMRRLKSAQGTWIAFRDAECAFASGGEQGGSIHPMIEAGCEEGLTRKRLADLNRYLTCPEGDLACPVAPK
jgi:uncharacterized protein YecT (DUF1311 family)